MIELKRILIAGLFTVSLMSLSCERGSDVSKETKEKSSAGAQPSVEVAKVISKKLNMTIRLPGEITPYEFVAVYPKVTGFVKSIGVDRGSRVKKDELIARLEAPELAAQRAQAQAQLQSAQSQLAGAQAKLAASESTYQKLKAASATPGVVAGNDLIIAEKAMKADAAQVKALQHNVAAAKQLVQSVAETEGYLEIHAPFDGVVTERNVHPGALVGPSGGPGASVPMVRIETFSRLRLIVPVPESYVAGILNGTEVSFTVPAFPDRKFTGKVARISHFIDVKTRTMPVELDVINTSDSLDPGTFCEVLWSVERPQETLFVPSSAVAKTLEKVFVVRIRNGETDWVDVRIGATSGKLTEVFGDLREGDEVALRGTDELRPGTHVTAQLSSQ